MLLLLLLLLYTFSNVRMSTLLIYAVIYTYLHFFCACFMSHAIFRTRFTTLASSVVNRHATALLSLCLPSLTCATLCLSNLQCGVAHAQCAFLVTFTLFLGPLHVATLQFNQFNAICCFLIFLCFSFLVHL